MVIHVLCHSMHQNPGSSKWVNLPSGLVVLGLTNHYSFQNVCMGVCTCLDPFKYI